MSKPYDVTGLNPAEAAAAAGSDAVITTPSNYTALNTADDTVPEALSQPVMHTDAGNDDMTFSQAFAAARQAMGPGASFTWHGQVYGTYYQNEWNALSPAEQQAFTAAATGNSAVNTPLEVTAIDEPTMAGNDTQFDLPDNIADDDSEIRIIGMESLGHGDNTINLATIDVDGNAVYMVDLDNDNIYDFALADFDGSGTLLDSADDIMPIDGLNITVHDVTSAMDMSTATDDANMMADTDFINTDDNLSGMENV